MKKILFIVLCFFLISCSNLYKAGKAYERGDYVQNVELTFKYFDEKPENFKKLKEKKKIEINNKFLNIFKHYENFFKYILFLIIVSIQGNFNHKEIF